MDFENSIDLFGDNLIVKLLGFLAGIAVLGIACFIDDSKGIPSMVKLAAQIVAAIIVIMCGIRIENFTLPFTDNKIFMNEIFSFI